MPPSVAKRAQKLSGGHKLDAASSKKNKKNIHQKLSIWSGSVWSTNPQPGCRAIANDDLFTAARQLKVINNQKRLQTGKLVAIGANAKALLHRGSSLFFPSQLFPFFGCAHYYYYYYYKAALIVNNNYYFISGSATPTSWHQLKASRAKNNKASYGKSLPWAGKVNILVI